MLTTYHYAIVKVLVTFNMIIQILVFHSHTIIPIIIIRSSYWLKYV